MYCTDLNPVVKSNKRNAAESDEYPCSKSLRMDRRTEDNSKSKIRFLYNFKDKYFSWKLKLINSYDADAGP